MQQLIALPRHCSACRLSLAEHSAICKACRWPCASLRSPRTAPAVPSRSCIPATSWTRSRERPIARTAPRSPPPPLLPPARSRAMLLTLSFSIGALLSLLIPGAMCFFNHRRLRAEKAQRISALEQQADRAAGGAPAGSGAALPLPPAAGAGARRRSRGGASSGEAAAGLERDSLRAPLLQPIEEGGSDEGEGEAAGAPLPAQAFDELPACVRAFLERAVRDHRRFKLFTLVQLGKMQMSPNGGWKEATATQRACPLEPAFVWTGSAKIMPRLVTLQGFDSFVEGRGYCSWSMWGSVPAASGGGPEVDQSLLVRWLAEAACFPQALQPSSFLQWEAVEGEEREAEAVLTYRGKTVRARFCFDRFSRVTVMRSRDFRRRLSDGSFETGEWSVAFSGHMLFGLSAQGDVMQEEVATREGVFIPTNMEATWRMPDGRRWTYASFTVAKVTAQ